MWKDVCFGGGEVEGGGREMHTGVSLTHSGVCIVRGCPQVCRVSRTG
jgi:hypothetical protein